MSQPDFASATPVSPHQYHAGIVAAAGAGRLEFRAGPLDAAASMALFADLSDAGALAGIAAWTGSRQQKRGQARAAALGVPAIVLGNGLLRAPPWRKGAAPVLSVTAVAISGPGSPADILSPTRVLASRDWQTPQLLERAAAARRALVSRQVGGSWWGRSELPPGEGIALVDAGRTGRSLSVPVLRAMLAAALAEHPAHKVVVLAPDRIAGRGLLAMAAQRGVCVLTGRVDPWAALARAERVYAAGSETGFLALLAGRVVRCFADCFYSGWGVTADEAGVARHPFARSVDEIFAGACLVATRHLDPFRNTASSFEETLAVLADWRQIETVNRRVAVLVGMSFWKRRRVADFLCSTAGAPVFRRTTAGALRAARGRPGGAIAVWASRMPAGLAAAAERDQVALLRVEDGFIRSVGLGSDFVPAASLVLDSAGMHYDPGARSDLECLLLETKFDATMLARADRLIAQLVARGVTKYNLAAAPAPGLAALAFPAGRRRILVPGQVEDDLSVRLGGGGVRGNLDLLGRVRRANPGAFILYKPHPDVEAGHRKGAVPDRRAREFADAIVRDRSTAALLADIDELHTLTSLAGFEALLRRRRVVVYGRPFYAGWGLTVDLAGAARGRRLALDELVAGALILYPRYLDPVTRLPCPPEIILERLDAPALWRPGPLVIGRRLQGLLGRSWSRLAGRMPNCGAGLR
jgi:capsular polysaccharide export protein